MKKLMNNKINKKVFRILIGIVIFTVISLIYFSPVLQGKKILQSDIVQFTGMSKEIVNFRNEHHQEPYWTDAAFGGMPAFQLSAYYPYNYIQKLDKIIRFLPRPADYLFLYLFGFFTLLLVLKVDYKLAILGAIGFGLSTYLIIILGVGHNAKAHAIGYMPLVLTGILLVFQKKKFLGFILTTLAMSLEIATSHIQMTYYLLFMVFIFGIVFLIDAVKNKEINNFIKNIALLIVAVILAIGVNATSLMATSQYAKSSTRSKSELTKTPEGKPKKQIDGLSSDYITEYSYGKLETLNLFIPNFTGGSNHENVGKKSNTYKFLVPKVGIKQATGFVEGLPTYWGNQPFVAAPAYIGSILIFLALLGFFLLKGKIRNWLVASIIFSILMSWGKNFSFLTDFFINYVPLYDKFRAVSSIQVIAELSVPLLAVLGLKSFLSKEQTDKNKNMALKKALFLAGGIALFFVLFGTSLFSFKGLSDDHYNSLLSGLTNAIVKDRKEMFFNDSLRSLIFVALTALSLWAFTKDKLKRNGIIIIISILLLVDLGGVDKRYLNNSHFVSSRQVREPIKANKIDKEIMQDKGHYRVANFMGNPMNEGTTSYFFNSIGGYHAAKPRRYQELYDYQISKNNIQVLNMLNTKYIIYPKDNKKALSLNGQANGNAWFIPNIKFVNSADKEINSLTDFNSKTTAIINKKFKEKLKSSNFELDSTATISLTKYDVNKLYYNSLSKKPQLAVFSEMYYKDWNAYVDGNKTPIIRANYVLRAIEVPAGNHKIIFKFEPKVVSQGGIITLISYAVFLLIILAWFFKKSTYITTKS